MFARLLLCAAALSCAKVQSSENTPALCQNGRDDDLDGKADCRDPNCSVYVFCDGAEGESEAEAEAEAESEAEAEAEAEGEGELVPGWTTISTIDAPFARYLHTAVWTGSEMIVWGGAADFDFEMTLDSGGRYDPLSDSWTPTSTAKAPSGRVEHTAVWTGSEMIVWGGANSLSYFGDGGHYDPVSDSWSNVAQTDSPLARWKASTVWTGSAMIVWGGSNSSAGDALGRGKLYFPETKTWQDMVNINRPARRFEAPAVWSGSQMVVWGGRCGLECILGDGGRYANSWSSITDAAAPQARWRHAVAWSGSEFLVWGGQCGTDCTLGTGARYNPATDSWIPMSSSGAPSARVAHSAVWTGSELIVWGGGAQTGGRYAPSADSWTATEVEGAPSSRWKHTAVWTGSEMIIWGGLIGDDETIGSGGRYVPN